MKLAPGLVLLVVRKLVREMVSRVAGLGGLSNGLIGSEAANDTAIA